MVGPAIEPTWLPLRAKTIMIDDTVRSCGLACMAKYELWNQVGIRHSPGVEGMRGRGRHGMVTWRTCSHSNIPKLDY